MHDAALQPVPRKSRSILPSFGLTMGYSLAYMSLLVLLPLAALALTAAKLSLAEFWDVLTHPRTIAAYRLSIGGALIAALLNTIFGVIIAWILSRYTFPGRRIVDALVDIPFALPTAVAGIALTAVYAPTGWLGKPLSSLGIQAAYNSTGIIIAMMLVSLPFVVRTLQPVLEEFDPELEEAADTLGADRVSIFFRVVLPALTPAILTGFALAFAKSIGEYGSIIFISSNMPGKTEIAPLLIMKRLEAFNYPAAAAIAVGLLSVSFILLLVINLLQAWTRRSAAL